EGTLLKVKGKRSKRIVIEIPGVAIAASYIEPDLIEVLN
ncbi:MAG: transcriptional regulator, partial [Bacteroidales bacterium]|nr:transcriptional regulator [Bacteroidales bacterium]